MHAFHTNAICVDHFIGQRQSRRQQRYNSDSLVAFGRLINSRSKVSLEIWFGSETTGCGFHSVNDWLVRLTRDLISLVNDNHVDNNLLEVLVYVYNFRPTSVLPILSKIIKKKCVWKKLMTYLYNYKLVHKHRSGMGRSTESALILIVVTLLKAINNGDLVGCILVDFRKAFDLVDHNLLPQKLRHYKLSEMRRNEKEMKVKPATHFKLCTIFIHNK